MTSAEHWCRFTATSRDDMNAPIITSRAYSRWHTFTRHFLEKHGIAGQTYQIIVTTDRYENGELGHFPDYTVKVGKK